MMSCGTNPSIADIHTWKSDISHSNRTVQVFLTFINALESLPVHCWKFRPCLNRRRPGNGGASEILAVGQHSDETDIMEHAVASLAINFIQNHFTLCLSMLFFKIACHPLDKVVFKYTLNKLVK